MKGNTLTTGEVAGYCGVNFRTVLRWIERGLLNSYQLPGRGDNRIPVEDFLAFLREHEMPIPAELSDRGSRILIVEDEPPMAQAIQRILRDGGFATTIADNGFAAGAQIALLRPALVTLDLRIPGIGGIDVLRFIRQTERLRSTRVLVVSAMPRGELDRALTAGADDALRKPIEPAELMEHVRRLTGVRAQAS